MSRKQMFSNYESDVVGFNCRGKDEKSSSDGSSQTTEFSTSEEGSSTNTQRHAGVQTDSKEPSLGRPPTPPGLASWLSGIAPMVFKELRINETSTVFSDYDPYSDESTSQPAVKLLQTLDGSRAADKHESAQAAGRQQQTEFPVTGLCWSAAGNTLAVGRGMLSHEDWCDHRGRIDIYIQSGREATLKHSAELKMAACSSSVAFHPTESPLLAAATVSGEIAVWNLQRLDDGAGPLTGRSGGVSSLLWLAGGQANAFSPSGDSNKILVSCGQKGIITVWAVNSKSSSFNQLLTYEVQQSTGIALDITCIDFSKFWTGTDLNCVSFAVGGKTGQVFMCRNSAAKSIAGSRNLDPVHLELEPHGSAVLTLSFSTDSPVLMTLGADMEIRTYSPDQSVPLRVVHLEHMASHAKWLPGSSSLVLVALAKPGLQIFDVVNGSELKLDGLEMSEAPLGPYDLTTLAFNSKSTNTVACGDMAGNIIVWSIQFNNIRLSRTRI